MPALEPVTNGGNPISRLLNMPNDSPTKTIAVAVLLCLVCSVVVAAAAISLRPIQTANQMNEMRRNILQVAGLYDRGGDVARIFDERIDQRIVDLRTGELTDEIDPMTFDQREAAADPARSEALAKDEDPAGIKRRADFAKIYMVKSPDGVSYDKIILPVHGYGLWSTMYGLLAVEPDGQTIAGLQFYEHGETPGLGGEIDNPNWRAQWPGKQLFDENGEVIIEVTKNASGDSEVDAISGASLTSRGVSNLVRYWAGENGFGPFLNNLSQELAAHG
ncbi:MAG: Na(+)-translocating NADH-quinone reductase subunit C [Geminicoccaceae bacterium]